MQTGERQIDLELHAGRAKDAHPLRRSQLGGPI